MTNFESSDDSFGKLVEQVMMVCVPVTKGHGFEKSCFSSDHFGKDDASADHVYDFLRLRNEEHLDRLTIWIIRENLMVRAFFSSLKLDQKIYDLSRFTGRPASFEIVAAFAKARMSVVKWRNFFFIPYVVLFRLPGDYQAESLDSEINVVAKNVSSELAKIDEILARWEAKFAPNVVCADYDDVKDI